MRLSRSLKPLRLIEAVEVIEAVEILRPEKSLLRTTKNSKNIQVLFEASLGYFFENWF